MRGTQGDGRRAPKVPLQEGDGRLRVQDPGRACFSIWGPGEGVLSIRRGGISGRGARPSSAVRRSHGFLPPAQLPKRLSLRDSWQRISREGVVLRKRGSRRLVLLAGLLPQQKGGASDTGTETGPRQPCAAERTAGFLQPRQPAARGSPRLGPRPGRRAVTRQALTDTGMRDMASAPRSA